MPNEYGVSATGEGVTVKVGPIRIAYREALEAGNLEEAFWLAARMYDRQAEEYVRSLMRKAKR
jgi:hypothetical protein